jgi:hypothetical protein
MSLSAVEKEDKEESVHFHGVTEEHAFASAPNIEEDWSFVLACQEQKSWTALCWKDSSGCVVLAMFVSFAVGLTIYVGRLTVA